MCDQLDPATGTLRVMKPVTTRSGFLTSVMTYSNTLGKAPKSARGRAASPSVSAILSRTLFPGPIMAELHDTSVKSTPAMAGLEHIDPLEPWIRLQ